MVLKVMPETDVDQGIGPLIRTDSIFLARASMNDASNCESMLKMTMHNSLSILTF